MVSKVAGIVIAGVLICPGLALCTDYLKSWAGTRFNHLGKRINNIWKDLNALMDYPSAKANYHQFRSWKRRLKSCPIRRSFIGNKEHELVG